MTKFLIGTVLAVLAVYCLRDVVVMLFCSEWPSSFSGTVLATIFEYILHRYQLVSLAAVGWVMQYFINSFLGLIEVASIVSTEKEN
jgi:uncharacterized membrane protein